MTLEHAFFVSQIVAAIALVVSLVFVGREIRANTQAIQRGEHNSTMEQWTVIRMAMAKHRDIAELMALGLDENRPLNRTDQLRLEQMLTEIAWAAFHIWDRTQRGIFPKGTFEFTGGALLCAVLATKRGGAWWRSARQYGFVPGFVADVDRLLGQGKTMPFIFGVAATTPASGATAPAAPRAWPAIEG
jgi:hypothetical protein